jgi:hypothetical protein
VRNCFATPSGGAFDARVRYPDTLLIVFEGERPKKQGGVFPPSTLYFTEDARGNTISITPKGPDLPAEANVQVVTEHQRFTINLRPGKEADAQLHVRDPDMPAREALIARRVEEAIAQRRAELDEMQRKLSELASSQAEEIIESELARSGMEVREPRGKAVRYKNVVFRPESVGRVGDRRFLLFSIQNGSGMPFHLKAVHLSADGRAVPIKPRVARQTLPVDIRDEERVPGVIPLPQIRSGAHLRVTI